MDDHKIKRRSAPTLRPATLSDTIHIHSLTTHLGYKASTLSNTEYQLKTLLESDRDGVFVAVQDRSIAGWIHCFQAVRLGSESFYEIGGLVVCPTKRRQGVGQELVNYAMAQHRGKWRVRCNSLRHESHLFYQELGFVQCKNQLIFDHQT